jgi:two-component system sensor histidine kinase KdpD
VEVRISPQLPFVIADQTALESVVFHLVDNALKYAAEGPVTIEASTAREGVRVQVTDCGPGIPPEKRHLLFQRFQRLDAHDSQSVYGYGLGLYLSRRLLEAMNSTLEYEAPAPGGARFFFDLRISP